MKRKIINDSGLNKSQKSALHKHSIHHTEKHIKSMIMNIKKGRSFKDSHLIAIKKLGK